MGIPYSRALRAFPETESGSAATSRAAHRLAGLQAVGAEQLVPLFAGPSGLPGDRHPVSGAQRDGADGRARCRAQRRALERLGHDRGRDIEQARHEPEVVAFLRGEHTVVPGDGDEVTEVLVMQAPAGLTIQPELVRRRHPRVLLVEGEKSVDERPVE